MDPVTALGVATTAFNTSSTISSANSLIVTIDGLVQKPSSNYSTSGATITFTSAPSASAEIEVRDLGIKTSSRRGTGFLLDTLL